MRVGMGYDVHKLVEGRDLILGGASGQKRTSDEQVAYLEELINKYPIDSIEDGMSENDWQGWKKLTDRFGTGTYEGPAYLGDQPTYYSFTLNVKF